jgi:hypothetical protein
MLPDRKNQSKAPAKRGAFSRALERFREKRAADNRTIRIGFIIDATGSREQTWETAQTIQGRMFGAVAGLGKARVRLVHFGGDQLADHGWSADTRALARTMAAVRCRQGLTQIIPALDGFLFGEKPDALILVGDAFEEHPQALSNFLHLFAGRRTPVFTFFEGDNDAAECAYREIAEKTGGRFARLGDDLPLGDLCEGVALLAGGGEKALRRLGNEKARRLLLSGPADRQS